MTKRKVKSEEVPPYIQTREGDDLIAAATQIIDARIAKRDKVVVPDDARQYLKVKLYGRGHEVFVVMFLNSRHEILAYEEMFRGTIDGSEVHPREVVKAALIHNASAVILGHNHPSGSAEPSAADRAVTVRLKQALALIDVRVLDHFIIGDGEPSSMAQRGLM